MTFERGIAVSSRYGREETFLTLKEACEWAKKQSELLQGTFTVSDRMGFSAFYRNGKEA